MMKEIKENLNACGDIPCLWFGKLNIVKMSVFPKFICKFNIIVTNISKSRFFFFFTRYKQSYSKIFTVRERTYNN